MSMYLIASQTINSTASGLTFSNIPQNFTHLQIRGFMQGNQFGNSMYMYYNTDNVGTNYYVHAINATGSAININGYTNSSAQVFGYSNGYSSIHPSCFIADIFDYNNTNKNKTAKSLSGGDYNATGEVTYFGSSWANTAAINQITFFGNGGTFSYGTFQLYGISNSSATGA